MATAKEESPVYTELDPRWKTIIEKMEQDIENGDCPTTVINAMTGEEYNEDIFSKRRTVKVTDQKGVSYDTKKGKWRAQIRHKKHQCLIGLFDTVDEASEAVINHELQMNTFNTHHGCTLPQNLAQTLPETPLADQAGADAEKDAQPPTVLKNGSRGPSAKRNTQ